MLHIKKRSLCQWLALYMFITPFLLNFLQDFLHLPGLVKYTIDVAWVVSLIGLIFAKRAAISKKLLPVVLFFIIFILYVFVVYLMRYQSVFYFLWGIRNNMRYYVAIISFAYFLDKDDIEGCLRTIDVLFVIHALVTFVQFFILGYKWDYLGGIFGVQLGCNGNAMILLIVVTTMSLLMYMHGKESVVPCLLKCALALIIAAMAELKFFFVIFVMILVLATFITKFSFRKMFMIAGMGLVVVLAGSIFTAIWGESSSLSFDRIIELVTSKGYSSEKDLGRFTALPIISRRILTDLPDKLFGLGLGNCDTSSFAICNTPFFQTHGYLNYSWFSSAFAFLETGYLGLTMMILFYVIVGICAIRLKQRDICNKIHADFAIVMSVTCIALFFYNSSLRTDIGYLAYFVLALPFASVSSESVFEMSQAE